MCLFSLSPGIFSPNFYKPHRSAGLLVNTQHSGKTKTMCQRFDVSFEIGLSMANCGWEHPYNWNIYPYYRIMNLKCVTVFLHKLKRILLKVPPAPLVTNKALLLEGIPVFWCILWLNVVVLFWSIGKKINTRVLLALKSLLVCHMAENLKGRKRVNHSWHPGDPQNGRTYVLKVEVVHTSLTNSIFRVQSKTWSNVCHLPCIFWTGC